MGFLSNQFARPAQIQQTGQQGQMPQRTGAATMAITQGPGGQMYTDGSMQTPYNPSAQSQPYQQDIARPINDNMRMDIRDRRARPSSRYAKRSYSSWRQSRRYRLIP